MDELAQLLPVCWVRALSACAQVLTQMSIVKVFSIDADKALEMTQMLHACRKVVKSRSPQTILQFDQVRRLANTLSGTTS